MTDEQVDFATLYRAKTALVAKKSPEHILAILQTMHEEVERLLREAGVDLSFENYEPVSDPVLVGAERINSLAWLEMRLKWEVQVMLEARRGPGPIERQSND